MWTSKLLSISLVIIISQRAYCQNDDLYAEEDKAFENDNEFPADAPSEGEEEPPEGSGSHILDENTATSVPIIDETEMTEAPAEDAIKCPTDQCTCSHEYEGENLKLTVDCSSKELTELPQGIDTRVKYLFLQNNKLTEVPKVISDFKELETLNVNNNLITEFAFGSVSEIPKLRVLKAANNRLLEFPQELKNGLDLRCLEELDLGGNDMRETLTAENFSHMESITSIIIPVSTPELIVELCHRLGTTLQKVCTNNCNVDIEECATVSTSEAISAQSSGMVENRTEDEAISEESPHNVTTEMPDNEDLSADPSASDVNVEIPKPQSDIVIEGITGEEVEIPALEDSSNNVTTSIEDAERPSSEFSLRSAVSNANDDSAGASVPAPETPVETPTQEENTRSGAIHDASPAEVAGVETDQVGAATVKQGGGIDNSVIAMIVAGMIVVVAGVTIKKNWSSIKNRFSSRPASAPTARPNGTAPEEVPLQDKDMV